MSRAAPTEARRPSLADLPDDLPGENDVVRALFHDRDQEALEFLVEDSILYLAPWCARNGGVAGFEQDADTFAVRPVEFTADEVRELLEVHVPSEVPLHATPAWLLSPESGEPSVSWHARVRWAERVKADADPAPAIREAWRDGLQVGVPRGYGRYYPPADVVVCYVGSTYDDPITVTTVLDVEDVRADEEIGADHLATCDVCSGWWNPQETETCVWCGARPPRPKRPRLPA